MIDLVNKSLSSMISKLRKDPCAIECIWMSIITFDREAKCILPLTSLVDLHLPEITTPDSGPTQTSLALRLLLDRLSVELGQQTTSSQIRDPFLCLITDGRPSNLTEYYEQVNKIKRQKWTDIIACGIGARAKSELLDYLSNNVYLFDTNEHNDLEVFFEETIPKLLWVWVDAPASCL